MNRVFSLFKSIRSRQILAAFILGITLLLTNVFGYGKQMQAQAQPTTPEAAHYQVPEQYAGKEGFDAAKQKIEDTAETVLEKLNLNEPQPANPKNFSNQVEKPTKNVVQDLKPHNLGY